MQRRLLAALLGAWVQPGPRNPPPSPLGVCLCTHGYVCVSAGTNRRGAGCGAASRTSVGRGALVWEPRPLAPPCCWRRPARSHFRSRPRRPETPIPTWPSPEGPPPLQTSCRCRLPPRPVILPQRADFRHRNPHRPRRPGRRRGCGCRRRRRAYRLANAW